MTLNGLNSMVTMDSTIVEITESRSLTAKRIRQVQSDAEQMFYTLLVEAFHIRHVLSLLPVQHTQTFHHLQ